eukprot:CAMPEP_0206187724 /NCGR_PEP_ID=MMETSP0166-20121206/3168_1 /ASSEMBLY_ACC=CAM_ASM_000260 /TAXON_ID=95228 /ORGANISM="Vannella robusta, Strain DIVA3 518/3/11/1/6" /LENGTH=233 /DNA_ID=CAMNT_0053603353 /DNA_START=201 /DNA_END=898 /DNA_ORIENTATION=-
MPVQKLCGGDLDRKLLFECVDWNRSGREDFIGSFETTLRELQGYIENEKHYYELIDEKRASKKKKYQNSGRVQILQCEIVKDNTFLEFLRGGMNISLMIALDFTASNGDPDFTTSLHHRNPYSPNEYIRALQSVGQVFANYDSDKSFPVFGFGGKPTADSPVSHCFPLNGNEQNPQVQGIDGIIQTYCSALDRIVLQGPTIFKEIIERAASHAQYAENTFKQAYTILLIITDG